MPSHSVPDEESLGSEERAAKAARWRRGIIPSPSVMVAGKRIDRSPEHYRYPSNEK
jgi:hypothetical protein